MIAHVAPTLMPDCKGMGFRLLVLKLGGPFHVNLYVAQRMFRYPEGER